jgi:tetratricopeptide (TPR) repeat protein
VSAPSPDGGTQPSTAGRRAVIAIGALFVAGLGAQWILGDLLNAALLQLPGVDKVVHFAAFAGLLVASTVVLRGAIQSLTKRLLVALAAGLALGVVIEIAQSGDPRRHVELADLAADACGLALGAAVFVPAGVWRMTVAATALAAGAYVTYDSHVTTRDYAWGVRAEARRDYATARRHYQKALESGMRTASLYNGLGWVEIESGEGDPAKAVEYAATALAMRPGDADILDTYGWALAHAGRPVEALPHLLESQRLKPRMYCIHYHLGQTYRRLGRLDDARREFELQLQRTPAGPDARLAQRALAELLDHGSR